MSAVIHTQGAGAQVRAVRKAAARRQYLMFASLFLVIVCLSALALSLGDFAIDPRTLFSALTGQAGPRETLVVWQLRMPRVLAAVFVGVALGMSGAIFQALVRNPLASPDVIGITSGASAAAVAAIVLLGVSGITVSFFAFCGAIVAAALIYLLAWRGNGVAGFRFVLIGIAIAAILSAAVSYMMTRANIRIAQDALFWLTGSLHLRNWNHVWPLVGLTGGLSILSIVALPKLRTLQLGDETAIALGTHVETARQVIIFIGVGLAAAATAAAGPVPFVALMAGAFGRILLGGDQSSIGAAGLVGAIIMLGADLAGQHAFAGVNFPVGVVTGLVGAPYLIWLLVRTHAKGRGE